MDKGGETLTGNSSEGDVWEPSQVWLYTPISCKFSFFDSIKVSSDMFVEVWTVLFWSKSCVDISNHFQHVPDIDLPSPQLTMRIWVPFFNVQYSFYWILSQIKGCQKMLCVKDHIKIAFHYLLYSCVCKYEKSNDIDATICRSLHFLQIEVNISYRQNTRFPGYNSYSDTSFHIVKINLMFENIAWRIFL